MEEPHARSARVEAIQFSMKRRDTNVVHVFQLARKHRRRLEREEKRGRIDESCAIKRPQDV